MAAELAVASVNGRNRKFTIEATGLEASTAYRLTIKDPSGWNSLMDVTSDGSGNMTAFYVADTAGSYGFELRTIDHPPVATDIADAGRPTPMTVAEVPEEEEP